MKYLAVLAFIVWGSPAFSQWDGAGGEPGSLAVHRNDERIVRWADDAEVIRGWYDITDKDSGTAEAGNINYTFGAPDNYTLSLGDSGVVTLRFNKSIRNIPGADFVVFENGFAWFSGYFLELAFVEVSTDGVRFVRFPAQSTADTAVQYTNNAAMDPTQYHNMAGKHQAPYGTPFDLEELTDSNGINPDSIHFIRLVDVVGIVDSAFASRDINGRIINDPWPTPFGTGGFDLDAVGIMGEVTNGIGDSYAQKILFVPNPVRKGQPLRRLGGEAAEITVYPMTHTGPAEFTKTDGNSVTIFRPGIYIIEIKTDSGITRQKICVTD